MLKMKYLVLAAFCAGSASCTSMKSATSTPASAAHRGYGDQTALSFQSNSSRAVSTSAGRIATATQPRVERIPSANGVSPAVVSKRDDRNSRAAASHVMHSGPTVVSEPLPVLKKSFLGLSISFSGQGLSITRATPPVARHREDLAHSSQKAVAVQTVRTTAYTHTENDHLAYGKKSAAGSNLKYGKVRSAAADWSVYPVGTTFQIEGDSTVYEIDDYGSALVGTETIDIYKPTKASMNEWGVRNVKINVLKWGSFDKSLAIMRPRSKYSHIRQMVQKIERVAQRSV